MIDVNKAKAAADVSAAAAQVSAEAAKVAVVEQAKAVGQAVRDKALAAKEQIKEKADGDPRVAKVKEKAGEFADRQRTSLRQWWKKAATSSIPLPTRHTTLPTD